MYPVVTKAFEVGSDQDTLQTSSANLIVGVGAGVLAVGVLTVGLFALSQQGSGGCKHRPGFYGGCSLCVHYY